MPDATNPFAYRAGVVPAKSRVPAPNTVAAVGPTQGALLLYKIKHRLAGQPAADAEDRRSAQPGRDGLGGAGRLGRPA